MMKSAFRCFQIVLLLFGVFGADEAEVKSVSVMEGDSVTLNPDLTQINKFNLIQWKFGDPVIAQTDGKTMFYPSPTERFRDRLQQALTGSLTIKNMKSKHSGLYELLIRHSAGNAYEKFNVTVYASVSDAGKSEMKSVSVMEGDPVTLQTDVTLSGDELIVWRFGDEGEVIAKADIEAKRSPLYYDERFRLELEQTGSLIITNTRTTDSGFYAVKISSKKQTLYKRFTVTVSVIISDPGLSPGAVAGIVVLLLCVAAAAAAGVIYFRRKISELQKQISTVSVTEGDHVTLKHDKEIKKDDYILWMFGEGEQLTCIAEIRGEPRRIVPHDDAAAGRFRGRLDLDMTGSLTIRNSRTTHSGPYTLHIKSSSGDSFQIFFVTVNEKLEEISVEEGDSVTLNPDPLKPDPLNPDPLKPDPLNPDPLNPGTEIQGGDQMLWMFGYQDDLIAGIRGGTVAIYDNAAGEIFRDRLELNKTTGSLTITHITPEHTGLYKLQTITSRGILFKKFRVFIPWRRVHVITGDPVHLSTDRPEIKRDDEIEWRFGEENSLIAEIKGGTGETYDGPDKRFRDRLQLDTQTGDLTIKNCRAEHAGDYKLRIHSSEGDTNRIYGVTIKGSSGKRGNESAAVEMRSLLDK